MLETTASKSPILVTGATGFLGGALTRALLSRGLRVRALGRNPQKCALLGSLGSEVSVADFGDRAAIIAACAGVDTVVHAGALSAPWGPAHEFHRANVVGTENLLAGCLHHQVRRLVHISSPSVTFNGRDQHGLVESAPYPRRQTSSYSSTKKLAEDLVNAASRQGLETVILRPKAIFGPGDTALLPRILAAAKAGRLVQIGDGKNLVDLTYVDNVVHAILLAIAAPGVGGRTFIITNDEHVRLWALLRQVLDHFGVPPPARRISPRLALFAALLMEAWARVDGREPALTRYSAMVLARTQTYDISAARRYLGYAPIVSVAEGLERTLNNMDSDHVA